MDYNTIEGLILKHGLKHQMMSVVEAVLFDKDGAPRKTRRGSSGLDLHDLSSRIPGNPDHVLPLLMLTFMKIILCNIDQALIYENDSVLLCVVELLREITPYVAKSSIRIIVFIWIKVKLILVLRYILRHDPDSFHVLNWFFPPWSVEYENELQKTFRIDDSGNMMRLKVSDQKVRSYLLESLLYTDKIEETLGVFLRESKSLAESFKTNFSDVWYDLIDSLPDTEVEEIIKGLCESDANQDPTRYQTVCGSPDVEAALLQVLSFLNADGTGTNTLSPYVASYSAILTVLASDIVDRHKAFLEVVLRSHLQQQHPLVNVVEKVVPVDDAQRVPVNVLQREPDVERIDEGNFAARNTDSPSQSHRRKTKYGQMKEDGHEVVYCPHG